MPTKSNNKCHHVQYMYVCVYIYVYVCRDENGAETDGTECYHICFHIFFAEAETNTETPEMNTEIDTTENGHGANAKWIRNRNRH